MLRSILIGMDGSAHCRAAVQLGIRWARRFDAVLVGLGVLDEPTICKREPVPIGAGQFKAERDRCLLTDARRRVERILDRFARRCAAEGVRCSVLQAVGAPDAQIVRESRRCDLVLLGQKTHFHFETQHWPDETLRDVLRQGSRPVVAVPEKPQGGKCVLVAYDGSPQADRAIQGLQALGLAGEDTVHVLSVDADPASAARLAEHAVAFLKLHNVEAVPRPLGTTVPVHRTILAQARELRARLMVMGAFGRPRWQELVFGSVTASVLEASPVPLFLCR